MGLEEKRNFQPVQVIFFSLLFFIFFSLLKFAHEVAMTIAMHPWSIAIHAEIFGNVIVIEFKTGVHKVTLKAGGEQGEKKLYSRAAFEHWDKDIN